MTDIEKSRLKFKCEQYGLELEIKFWQDQQQRIKDEMYWHYTDGRIQALSEKLDQIRRKLEGVGRDRCRNL